MAAPIPEDVPLGIFGSRAAATEAVAETGNQGAGWVGAVRQIQDVDHGWYGDLVEGLVLAEDVCKLDVVGKEVAGDVVEVGPAVLFVST